MERRMFVFMVALGMAGLAWQFWPVTVTLTAAYVAARLIVRHERRKG